MPCLRSVVRALFIGGVVSLVSACGDRVPDEKESLRKAETFFAAGDYGSAEVELKNTLTANPRNTAAMLRLASIWEARGGPFQAVILYRAVKNLSPKEPEVFLGIADFFLAVGDRHAARKEILELLQNQPDHREALVLLARLAASEEEARDVEKLLELIPEADRDARIWYAKALLALALHDLDAAGSALTRSIELNPESPDVHTRKAHWHSMRNEPAEAEASLREASRLAPTCSPELINYATFLLVSKKRDEAVALLESAAKKAPDFIAAWRMLAKIAMSENETQKARDYLQKVSAWDAKDFETNVLSALLYLSEKDGEGVPKAIAQLEQLRSSHPPNSLVEYSLGRARLAGGETDLALEALQRAVNMEPNMRDAVFLLAAVNMKLGRHAEVVSLMDRFLSEHPGDMDAVLISSEAARLSGRADKSWAALSSIAEVPETNLHWHLEVGLVAKLLGNDAEARKSLELVEKSDPTNPRAAAELVDLDLAAGQYVDALKRAEKQLEINPGQTAAWLYMRAKILDQMSRRDEALADVTEALRQDPKMVPAHLLLSGIHAAEGRDEEAVAQLDRANAEVPGSHPVLITLANLHHQANRMEEFRKCYEEIHKFHPDDIQALNNLAVALSESKSDSELDRALQLAQEALRLAPHEPLIADTLGWVLFRKGEFQRAHRYLSEAIAKVTDDPSVHFHYGMSCLVMADEASARSALRVVADTSKHPRQAQAAEILSRLDARLESNDAAIGQLEAAVSQEPLDMVSRLKLAALLENGGRHADAATVYLAALEKNPGLYPAISRLAHLYAGPLEDSQKAYQYVRKASEIMPDDTSNVCILAKLAFHDGEHERADVLYQNALSKITGDSGLNIQAAWAAYSVGRVNDAKKLMEAVMTSATDSAQQEEAKLFMNFQQNQPVTDLIESTLAAVPDYVPALMARASVVERDDPQSAIPDYEKVIELYPKFTPAREAIARIRDAEAEEKIEEQ